MEFGEKLAWLRKERGLTQEELAEALYVSRTAVSKWESGRGYPGIDSLRALSGFFSVSIDDLLSGEKLLSIAEQENRANLRRICEMIFGAADLLSLSLFFLPLFPKTTAEMICAVSLFAYTETTAFNRMLYITLFAALTAAGAIKLLLTGCKAEKGQKLLTALSLALSIFTVLFLSLAREAYAVSVAFLLLLVKGVALFGRKRY